MVRACLRSRGNRYLAKFFAEKVRSSAGNEEEKVFGARFLRARKLSLPQETIPPPTSYLFVEKRKKKLCVFLKRFAGLFCDPGTRVTRKEFGSELSVTSTHAPCPGTNRRKLSYESLGYLCMQSKGYAAIES